MPSSVEVKSDLKGLDTLLKNVSTKLVAKVGIFGDENQRDEGEATNADIGAVHEFGSFSKGIPRRSFLKDPITHKRKELIKKAKEIIDANIDKENGDKKIFELIGIYGESIIQEAFESGGFGMWQPLSQKTINRKGSATILMQSPPQLRRSIASKTDKRNGNT